MNKNWLKKYMYKHIDVSERQWVDKQNIVENYSEQKENFEKKTVFIIHQRKWQIQTVFHSCKSHREKKKFSNWMNILHV